jgi:hypothetical protein
VLPNQSESVQTVQHLHYTPPAYSYVHLLVAPAAVEQLVHATEIAVHAIVRVDYSIAHHAQLHAL